MPHILTDEERELIVVVPASVLFGFDDGKIFSGFVEDKTPHDFDFLAAAQENFGIMTKGKRVDDLYGGVFAEADTSYLQVVPYTVIINPERKEIYVHERKAKEESNKENLEGLCSIGVSSHCKLSDLTKAGMLSIKEVAVRSLLEKTNFNSVEPFFVGYISTRDNPIGRVHFGFVYYALTDQPDTHPLNPRFTGKLMPINEIGLAIQSGEIELESWSKTLFPKVADYVAKLESY